MNAIQHYLAIVSCGCVYFSIFLMKIAFFYFFLGMKGLKHRLYYRSNVSTSAILILFTNLKAVNFNQVRLKCIHILKLRGLKI